MKKTIELTLEKARELYGKNPEMDELLLANFGKDELAPIYKIGDRFKFSYGLQEEWILAQVLPLKVCLISLKNGNRHKEPVEIEDPYKIPINLTIFDYFVKL